MYTLANVAWSCLIADRTGDANAALDEVRELSRDVRDPLMEGWILTVRGLELDRTGRTEEALDALGRAVATGERFRVGPGVAWALAALGAVQRESGRLTAADGTLRKGLVVAEEAGNAWGIARCGTELALIAATTGDSRLDQWLATAIPIWQRRGTKGSSRSVTGSRPRRARIDPYDPRGRPAAPERADSRPLIGLSLIVPAPSESAPAVTLLRDRMSENGESRTADDARLLVWLSTRTRDRMTRGTAR